MPIVALLSSHIMECMLFLLLANYNATLVRSCQAEKCATATVIIITDSFPKPPHRYSRIHLCI